MTSLSTARVAQVGPSLLVSGRGGGRRPTVTAGSCSRGSRSPTGEAGPVLPLSAWSPALAARLRRFPKSAEIQNCVPEEAVAGPWCMQPAKGRRGGDVAILCRRLKGWLRC